MRGTPASPAITLLGTYLGLGNEKIIFSGVWKDRSALTRIAYCPLGKM